MSQATESTPLPKRQDTGEFILLKRTHVNWYAPALYKMTGGSFDEMLTALRALPKEHRRFEDDWHTGKRWVVNQKAMDTLQGQGFSIEKEADIRLVYSVEALESHVFTNPFGEHRYLYRLTAILKVRNQQGQMQEIERIPVIVHDGDDPWGWTRKVEETQAACQILSKRIVGAWEEARQKDRSLEAWVRAADAIKPYLGHVFIWCGHDMPETTCTEYQDTQGPATMLLPAPQEEAPHARSA